MPVNKLNKLHRNKNATFFEFLKKIKYKFVIQKIYLSFHNRYKSIKLNYIY